MSSKSTTELKMTNNVLVPGGKAQVTIRCDNSKCDSNVKCFKFKFVRNLWYKSPKDGVFKNHTTLIANRKVGDCPAKMN